MAVIDKKTRRSLSNSRAESSAGTGAAGSRYEALFGVEPGRNRRPGRPEGSGEDKRFVFSTLGRDKDLAKRAKQRAIAVVIHENKDRMRELYDAEYEALRAASEKGSEGPETP